MHLLKQPGACVCGGVGDGAAQVRMLKLSCIQKAPVALERAGRMRSPSPNT